MTQRMLNNMSDTDSGRESPQNFRSQIICRHPKLIDNDRNTKLHYAAAQNDMENAKRYLEREKHEVDPENYLGWTPLMMACRNGHFDMVKYLLSRRANSTKTNKYGVNVFQIAIASGRMDLVKYMLDYFLTGGISIRILERNFPVTALAILYRQHDVLEYLIEKQFDINKKTPGIAVTPLMLAQALENEEAVDILQKHKVDATIQNYLGHTAVDISNIRQNIKNLSNPGRSHFPLPENKSMETELQNQHLRNLLQLNNSENTKHPTTNFMQSMCSPQYPCIILTPCAMMPQKNSSNISPMFFAQTPNVSPITPQSAIGPQIFFPSNISSSAAYEMNTKTSSMMTTINNEIDMNQRINSSAQAMYASPVINFMSPCM